MAHNYRLQKEYTKPKAEGTKPKLKSVTVIHTGRGGRRIVGVETSLKRAQTLVIDDRTELLSKHLEKNPNDRMFVAKLRGMGVSSA